jgi:hypothetical protein
VEEEEVDATEALRICVMVIGLVINAVIMWDYLKDRPDVMVARQRLRNLWAKHVTKPEKEARELRLATGEVVFEAITIVEGAADAGS